MSNKTKGIIYLLLFCMASMLYGAYLYATLNGIRDVQIHQWLLTGLVGLLFLSKGIEKIENGSNG
jgi:hypothetical protein